MSYDVNPRVDLAFKKIFGVEENKDLTISLINSIVSKEDQVVDLTLLNPYNTQNFAQDKLSILDIKAQGHDGKLFNIEIQVSDEADYDKRALYYWGKLYTQQLKAGDDYGKLSKAIGIHILNFISIPEVQKYHNVFHLTEKECGFHYFKDLELHTIELNKFDSKLPKDLQDFVGKIKNSLDVWSSFLTRHDLMNSNALPTQLDNPELKKALDVLHHINLDDMEREAYESRLKWLRIETNTLKKQFNLGKEAGEAKGKEEGLKEGKEEGLKEGVQKVAKILLQQGQHIDFIVTATGLTEEEIQTLSAETTLSRKA